VVFTQQATVELKNEAARAYLPIVGSASGMGILPMLPGTRPRAGCPCHHRAPDSTVNPQKDPGSANACMSNPQVPASSVSERFLDRHDWTGRHIEALDRVGMGRIKAVEVINDAARSVRPGGLDSRDDALGKFVGPVVVVMGVVHLVRPGAAPMPHRTVCSSHSGR